MGDPMRNRSILGRNLVVALMAALPMFFAAVSSAQQQFTLAISIPPPGSARGNVIVATPAGTPWGFCEMSCANSLAQNISVVLTPMADAGAQFTGWSGACTGMGPCNVSMDANKSVGATFANSCSDDGVQASLTSGENPIDIYNSCQQQIKLLYGKTYQGGLIAYVNTTDGSGFVAAPVDSSSGAPWSTTYLKQPRTYGRGIGDGKPNTQTILQVLGDPNPALPPYAASYSKTANFNNYQDWYLPSLGEMSQIITNRVIKKSQCDGDNPYAYWSSTERHSYTYAYAVFCGDGRATSESKPTALGVRLIRYFQPSLTLKTSPASVQNGAVVVGGSFNYASGVNISSKGICYATQPFPATSTMLSAGSGTANYSATLLNILPNTVYYASACATKTDGTAIYGNQAHFNYPLSVGETSDASQILWTSAVVGGVIDTEITQSIQDRGVVYSSNWTMQCNNPSGVSQVSAGAGPDEFSANLSNLAIGNSYYYCAYVTDVGGNTQYGGRKSFTTLTAPTSNTVASTNAPTSLPSGSQLSCNNQSCSVLQWGGYTYWPLGYTDSRTAMNIIAVDSNKNIVQRWPVAGTRYLSSIGINTQSQVVTFNGQSGTSITMPWSVLLSAPFAPSIVILPQSNLPPLPAATSATCVPQNPYDVNSLQVCQVIKWSGYTVMVLNRNSGGVDLVTFDWNNNVVMHTNFTTTGTVDGYFMNQDSSDNQLFSFTTSNGTLDATLSYCCLPN